MNNEPSTIAMIMSIFIEILIVGFLIETFLNPIDFPLENSKLK